MHQTCSQNPPQESPSQDSTNERSEENISNPSWSQGTKCESSNRISFGGVSNQLFDGSQSSSQRDDDLGLLAIFGSKTIHGICISDPTCSTSSQKPHQFDQAMDQTSTLTSQVQNKQNSDSETLSPINTSMAIPSSAGPIISRRSPLPLSVINTSSLTSSISDTSNLTLSYIIQHIGSIVSNSGSASLSSVLLCQFPVSQIHHRILEIMQRSLPAFGFIPGSGSSTSQLGQAPVSPDEIGLQNHIELDHVMRRQYVESALFMYRLADNLLEGSVSLMILTSGNGLNLRLASQNEQDIQVFSQPPILHSVNEMRDHYRDMRLDVDNMSYEELLALEDHIGNVNTGLSEGAVIKSLKHSKYFIFAEENAQKECCSICQEDYVEQDELGTLSCGHGFHIACIKQWLRCKNLCPICKSTGFYTINPAFSQVHSP